MEHLMSVWGVKRVFLLAEGSVSRIPCPRLMVARSIEIKISVLSANKGFIDKRIIYALKLPLK